MQQFWNKCVMGVCHNEKLKYMKWLSLIFALAICGVSSAQELKENLKFGKPTMEEMELVKYESEPDAEAIVLCKLRDEYYHYTDGDFEKIVDHKVRIKVLKQEGTDYANVSCLYYASRNNNGPNDRIRGISATAYNLEGGKVVATKMKNDLVFRERVSENLMMLKFTVPQVKVGTVIEYTYTETSDNVAHIDDWFAQGNIPVLYTRYMLTVPECYAFSVENSGLAPLEVKTEPDNMTIPLKNGDVTSLATSKYIFVGRNLPSLKDDNSVWCIDDYRSKVTCDFLRTQHPLPFKSYTSTWENISNLLMEDEDFGGRLSNNSPLKEEVAALGLDKMESVDEKVAAIYSLLMSKVKWDGDFDFYSKKRASAVLKDGTGSNVDINFMLINMLKGAGIEACPLLVRMRQNGHLPFTHPSLKKMNTFVVAFSRGEEGWGIVDASSKSGYIDVIMPQLMSDKGMLLMKNGIDWINLSDRCSGREATHISAEVKPDGTIAGKRSKYYLQQYSLLFKESMKDRDSIDVEEKVGNKLEAKIKNYLVDGDLEAFTSSIREEFDFEKSAQGGGDIIYVNPMVFKIWDENPYTNEKREVPIERPIKTYEEYAISLTIPEGYDVEELPKPLNIKNPDGTITCRVLFAKNGNVINVTYRYQVNRLFYMTEEYDDLRQIYDLIYSKCNEMIAIKKM